MINFDKKLQIIKKKAFNNEFSKNFYENNTQIFQNAIYYEFRGKIQIYR